MPIQVAPCDPWPVELDCSTCRDILPDTSPGESPAEDVAALIDKWSMVASEILWALSGRRWGPSCPLTVRPCRKSCIEELGITARWGIAGQWIPYIDHQGVWRNASPCSCGDDCGCGELCEVRLDGPVYDILAVTVDGITLDPSEYRVDAPNMLVRTNDECWPSCSDLLADCDEPGAFCVTYRWGLPLTKGAIAAVSELTCQFLRACPELAKKDCPCQLPGRVQRVVRQGVTVDMINEATSIFDEGRTGLTIVDAWLSAVNPHKLTSPPRVLSPDFKRPRLTTWAAP